MSYVFHRAYIHKPCGIGWLHLETENFTFKLDNGVEGTLDVSICGTMSDGCAQVDNPNHVSTEADNVLQYLK